MTQIQIDAALQRRLGGMRQPIVFYKPTGQVLGHYLPEPEFQRMLYVSIVKPPLSDEEVARRRRETGGSSLEGIWKKLGRR